MINGRKILAIIPARSGSKRVVNKNIRDLGGQPLITWTLKALSQSRYVDQFFVSTDSKDIQSIAREHGFDCEPLRPAELASDTANSVDVVLDIIKNVKPGFDIIVLLQPTSPFRTTMDLDSALEFFIEKSADSVTSVCESDIHPSWMSPLPADQSMTGMVKTIQKGRSQDLEKYYCLNGAIYIINSKAFISAGSFFAANHCYAYVMDRKNSVDIDTEEDLVLANCLLTKKD